MCHCCVSSASAEQTLIKIDTAHRAVAHDMVVRYQEDYMLLGDLIFQFFSSFIDIFAGVATNFLSALLGSIFGVAA